MFIFSATIEVANINMGVIDMLQAKVFKEDWEVGPRLSSFGGVTKDELMTVVEKAVGARADAVPHDPVTAAGLLSYIYGTRGLRDVFAAKGWIPDSTTGIESIYVRAELSRPLAIKGGQFSAFIERIFILRRGEWNPITPSKRGDYPLFQDFDIPVTRK